MKRSFFFVLVMFLVLCVGCSKKSSIVVAPSLAGKEVLVGNIPITFPLVKKQASLNIMTALSADENYDDMYMFKKYEEMTNVNVNWTQVKRSDRNEQFASALTNKQNIDLIMRFKTAGTTTYQYGKNGYIIDLMKDDLLEKNAPNCWNYLKTHPDTLASILNPDGTIYSLPQVNSGAELRVSRKIFINKNWLSKVNLSIPKTTEEFYQMLKAFKTNDANNNGIDDEIPLCPYDWPSMIESFYGAFGLGNRGQQNAVVDWDSVKNSPRYIAGSNEYKQFLQYFNKLYNEDLLYEEFSTISKEEWVNFISKNQVGVFALTNLATVPTDKANDWVAIEDALIGPNGDQLWAGVRANFNTTGAATIPSTCSNPELVLKWLDYFWTDEGTLFYHMGIEGETFYEKEDGTYDYMQYIYDEIENKNMTFDQGIVSYSPYPSGGNPTVEIAPYFMGGEMAKIPADAARSLFKYGPTVYWPIFTFTESENEELSQINKGLNAYVDEARVDFITGERDFSTWDTYVSDINTYNVSRLLTIYDNAIERYEVLLTTKFAENNNG